MNFVFNFNFNSNEYKFLCYFYGCRNNIAILDKFDATGACFFSLKKHAFVDRVFNFNVSLWKAIHVKTEFFPILQYLLATSSTDIIVENFKYDLLKVSKN